MVGLKVGPIFYNSELKHIYFTSPYLWEDKLEDFKVQNKKIYFLLAIPLSGPELEFIKQNGADALEALFEQNETDIFDVYRKSIL
jgi:hypothetical protein